MADLITRPAGGSLAAAVAALAGLRGGRPFHARGVLLRATLTVAEDEAGATALPQGEVDAVARLSLSAGLPRGWPDVVGLAVRWTEDGDQQDLLFSSSGRGRLTRFSLAPRRDLLGGWFSTIMPLRSPEGPVVLALRPDERATPAADGVTLEMLSATPLGPWLRFAGLHLHGPLGQHVRRDGDDPGVRFDPTSNAPHRLGTYRWEDLLRGPAYAAARRAGPG